MILGKNDLDTDETYEVYPEDIAEELAFDGTLSFSEAAHRAASRKQLERKGYTYCSIKGIRHKVTKDELGNVKITPAPFHLLNWSKVKNV